MIQNLRYYSQSWFFKAFLAVIVFCFVFIGVGDLIRSFIYDRPIAVVGKHTISQEEFDRALRVELRRIQMATKSQISLQDLNQFGFVEKVLDRLIAQHLLDQEMDRMGITASENIIRSNARSMEPFLRDGQFDPSQFKSVLRNAGITEQAFVQDIKKQLVQQQYFSTFAQASMLPDYYKNMLLESMLQKRVFATVFVGTKSITVDSSQITEDGLKNFYDKEKSDYKEPETRNFSVVYFDVKKMSQSINIGKEDIEQFYEARKEIYAKPEERHIYKVSVTTEEDLKKLQKLVDQNVPVTSLSQKMKDVNVEDLGSLKKNAIPEEALESVLNMQAEQYSEAIQNGLGYTFYYVKKILPQQQKQLSEVKNEIVDELRSERFQENFRKLRNKIEDDIAGGEDVEKVVKEHKLQKVNFVKFAATDVLNPEDMFKDSDKEVKQQIFELSEGGSSNIFDTTPYKSFMVFVHKVNPEHVPDFDQVKGRVKQDFIEEKKREKAEKIAHKIATTAKNIESLAKVASENGVTLQTNKTYSRMSLAEDKKVQENGAMNLFDKSFSLPLNKALFSPVKDGYLVVMPEKDLKVQKFDEKEKEDLLKRFEQIMYESIATFLTQDLRARYKVDIKKKNMETYLKMVMKD